MRLTRFDGRWIPAGATDRYDGPRMPDVGTIVAYDYRAWEVTHVRPDEFTEEEQKRANVYKPEHRDMLRGYHVSLRRLHGPKHHRENSNQDIALVVHAHARWRFEVYDEGRVPLCSCCGHPWPCIISVAKAQSEEEAKRLEKKLARAAVGFCFGCGEPITQRQKSAQYGDGNVDLPGYPTPRFHLRESCRYERVGYMGRVMEAQGTEAVTGPIDYSLWRDES